MSEELIQDQPVLKKQKVESQEGAKLKVKKPKKLKNCRYWDTEKGRKCTIKAPVGQKYCELHRNTESITKKTSDENSKEASRRNASGDIINRVVCPIDPSHTVWEDKLKKHMLNCNVIKKANELKEKSKNCPWFEIDYNIQDSIKLDQGSKPEPMTNDEIIKFINHIDSIYCTIIKEDLPLVYGDEVPGLKDRFQQLKNQKHIIQQSSLIGHLVRHDLFNPSNIYVEWGCGRAEFSRYLMKAMMNSDFETRDRYKFLFVDRSSPKMKFDTKMIKDHDAFYAEHTSKINYEKLSPHIERLKVDIKDLRLSKAFAPFETGERKEINHVGLSKHLCGVATDLTLRCITQCSEEMKNEESQDGQLVNFSGLIVAMCCRHCCDYNRLLPESRTYLEKYGIGQREFESMTKIASWATSGTGCSEFKDETEREEETKEGAKETKEEQEAEAKGGHFTNLNVYERELIGLKVRRIIDESRLYAMRSHGYECELIKYVDKSVSLENHCLIVKPQNRKTDKAESKAKSGGLFGCTIV